MIRKSSFYCTLLIVFYIIVFYIRGLSLASAGLDEWTSVGPYTARADIRSLAIDPSIPSTVYAGTSGCGIYKSTDGGATWSQSVGMGCAAVVNTLLIDPSPNGILYAGTNNGLHKSTDMGRTWTNLGPSYRGYFPHILTMVIDPYAPNTMY